ncbi:MAG: hypothetical protein IKU84_01410 [Clostridia bacterium]|nr:hypothetical protein [Clostridia bacterium]
MAMKGHFLGRILYVLFAVFVVIYLVGVVWNNVYDPVSTVTALHITAEDSIETDGFVIREEKILGAVTSGVVEMQVSEGERAAKGDAVAYVYASQSDLDKVHKKKDLSARIDRLENLMNQGNEVVDLKTIDNAIVKMSEELSSYCETNNYSKIPQTVDEMKNKTLSREYVYRDKSDLKTVIDGLKAERTAIGNVGATKAIYAPNPGYYSGDSDGLETVLSCSKIEELTPSRYKEIDDGITLNSQNDGTLGKLVTEFYWNYATLVSIEDAERISVGKKAQLSFENPVYPEVTARVQWKSEPENGKVCVVFRVDEHVGDFTLARKLRANVVIRSYEGLKVPREALRMNEDGEQGVYCLIDSQVKFKPVETIFEKESYYIVAYDSTNTKSLLLYDEIVVSAKELEHKKMVK